MESQDLGVINYLWAREYRKKWTPYKISEMDIINEAFQNGQKTVSLYNSQKDRQICINFDRMTQRKAASGNFQNLACGIAFERECFIWLWDNEESFDCYRPGLSLRLEIAYRLKHEKVKFYLHDDYEVDLQVMTQVNINSGYLREVQRVKMFASLNDAAPFFGYFKDCTNQLNMILLHAVNVSFDVIYLEIPRSRRIKMSRSKRKSSEVECQPSKKSSLVPVDPECEERCQYNVHIENDIVYHATLNQTNVMRNNNKFFIIQLLQHQHKKTFAVYFRWGRVGARGQNNLIKLKKDLIEAKAIFEKKFFDKTRNEWQKAIAGIFVKAAGKYDFLEMDLSPEDKDVNFEAVESKLDKKIQSLLELVCDRQVMENIMKEMSYDSTKTPLGKLTVKQINDGYKALCDVVDAIQSNKGKELVDACNEFYTKIPHNFGRRAVPIMKTMEEVEDKMQMLEALENIRVALEVMGEKTVEIINPLDKYYKSLHCTLDVIAPSSNEFKALEYILEVTRGPTHNLQLKIVDAFRCYKESEHKNFKDYGRSLLLWHGSRLSNWVGILRKGLLIAPPEAPKTGYMFGKGIYFADVSTKSANYCNMNEEVREGLLLLSEVSVGKSLQLKSSEAMPRKLDKSFNSVHGLGRIKPSTVKKGVLSSEADTCFGPLVEDLSDDYELIYNEFVVYDVHQVKLKYLLRVALQ